MDKPKITANFTIEDIHKIREYHHSQVMELTGIEKKDFYKKWAFAFLKNTGIQPKEIINLQ